MVALYGKPAFVFPHMIPAMLAILNSLAPSSWICYEAVWRLWCSFLKQRRVTSNCFSEDLVLSFLNYLMGCTYSSSHILKTLSGVSFFLNLHGYASCIHFFPVKQALKGYYKAHIVAEKRLPISADLVKICSATTAVCFQHLNHHCLNFPSAFVFIVLFRSGSCFCLIGHCVLA